MNALDAPIPTAPAPSCRIVVGDALEQLRTLPDGSVHCCVTSPPYWGLRDYKCPGQIGMESSPGEFVARLVAVFDEVHRVLRDDGNLWVNLGDSYYSNGGHSDRSCNERRGGYNLGNRPEHAHRAFRLRGRPKDLVGMPWRVALALQDSGWYLREDIIWHKRNPMPESVRDRCTRSHEYLFHLTKRPRYYFDAAAISEPVSGTSHPRGHGVNPKAALFGDHPRNVDCTYHAPGQSEQKGLRRRGLAAKACGANSRMHCDRNPAHQSPGRIRAKQNRSFSAAVAGLVERRNKRSVWSLATKPYRGAHFATFPPELVEPCIRAGCPPGGVVLDPFAGSGTTGAVALSLGRSAVLIELSPVYARLIEERIGKVRVAA
ncbi:MAG: site-specific DNA-methyltransferase [Verrucomicrobia bacterium]|nr:site-specific DNA-methyltransferase [Verrucomicrobiota bacterium]